MLISEAIEGEQHDNTMETDTDKSFLWRIYTDTQRINMQVEQLCQ